MIVPDPNRPPGGARQRGRIDPVLPQVALLVAVIAIAAILAFAMGGFEVQKLVAAALVGMAVAGMAVHLLVRHTRARTAAQTSLQSAEARVAGIVESAMDPIVAIDERQRVVLFNAAAESAFRWPRQAVLGQPIDMLIPERFREGHRRHVERFGQTGTTSRRMGGANVLAGLRADGQEFPIEASISQHREAGKPIYTVILRDISHRMRSDASLARSEARLRGILDSAMDAIIAIDEAQRIVLFNAAAERMFGCPVDQAIGAPLSWFIPERFREHHGEHVRRFGATGVTSRRMGAARVVTGVRRSGDEFPIDASISQVEDGGARFYTVILRDVSDRIRAENELRKSKDELKELATAAATAREQEKVRIARELHDELAQAMTGLKMDIGLLRLSAARAGSEFPARLDKMDRQVDQTIASVRRIAADLRPLTLDDFGLVPAIEALVTRFREQSRIACELAMSHPEFSLTDIQSTSVFRIIQEALTNVARHARATQVEITIVGVDGQLMVTVRDNGVGFAADGERKPNSFGLVGLKERAYLLGGDASVTSGPGRGTEIEVRFPVARVEARP
jgi:PAS domain S-box-containing protein